MRKEDKRLFNARSVNGVSAALKSGSDVNARSEDGSTPLHSAVRRHKTELINALIMAGADIDAQDNCGRTPLHLAAGQGIDSTINALVTEGADVNVQDNAGWTALHCVADGADQVTRAFVHGADMDGWDVDDDAYASFMSSCAHSSAESAGDLVGTLLDNGADIGKRDHQGRLPVDLVKGNKILMSTPMFQRLSVE